MARKFLTAIDLVQNELQNPRIHNVPGTIGPPTPVKGQMYFDSTGNVMYWWDGSLWVAAKSAAAAFGNVTAEPTFGSASNNGAAGTVARSDHAHGNPVHDAAAHSAISLSALAVPTGALSMNGQRLTNLGTPTTGTDGTTKDYVDNLSAGLSWKDAVRAASIGNLTLSAPQTVDGVAVIAGDRVLVKNQTTPSQNGIYVVAAGAWTRATDADTEAELVNATVFVSEGTQADTAWVLTTNAPITVNTTALTIVQFGAGTSYTAGNGLTLTGSTFDIVPLNGSIVVAADSVAVGFAASGGDAGTAVLPARGDHLHSALYTRKYAVSVGGSVTATVTHNLGTKDVNVQVYRVASPFDEVECDVELTDTNTVTLRFAIAPAASEYRCVVIG